MTDHEENQGRQKHMEQRPTFSYQYSAQQNREAEDIRKKYLPKEISKMEQLKALDRRVQTAGMVQGLTLGIIGVLVFGIGMCFGLGGFEGPQWPAVPFCLLGTCLMAPAYPVSRAIFQRTKDRLTPEILRLSDEILGSGQS